MTLDFWQLYGEFVTIFTLICSGGAIYLTGQMQKTHGKHKAILQDHIRMLQRQNEQYEIEWRKSKALIEHLQSEVQRLHGEPEPDVQVRIKTR